MSENAIANNDEERERLLPVVIKILGLYVIIMTIAYFVGNMIYQIP